MVRLAGGVRLGRDQRAWLARPIGELVERWPTVPSQEASSVHGAAVAVGPADSTAAAVARALDELATLVTTAGVVAAGADVDLGDGFRSGRLEGAPGDRRDAVLAALRALWPDGVERLGDRAAVVTSLLGPRATRRLGAALARAADEGRWPAVHLAAAASDLLGPERLERVLELDAPDDADVVPGAPSALAMHLAEVFGPLPEARRLHLLLDLWQQVRRHHELEARKRRRERLLEGQRGHPHLAKLRRRRQAAEDDWLVSFMKHELGHTPTLAEAALWAVRSGCWGDAFQRVMEDAFAATALLRVAIAADDIGLETAVLGHVDLLAAGARPDLDDPDEPALLEAPGKGRPARVAGTIAAAAMLLAKPELPPGLRLTEELRGHGFEGVVRRALVTARNHGLLAMERTQEFLRALADLLSALHVPFWSSSTHDELIRWRRVAGYRPGRPPQAWDYRPLSGEGVEPLAQRLAAEGDDDPPEVESPWDLVWMADLADALADLYGCPPVEIDWGNDAAHIFYFLFPSPGWPEPLRPPLDSVPGAVAGASQLTRLGASVPPRPRSWEALSEELLGSEAVAESEQGSFDVPDEILAWDGQGLPGTELSIQVGRTARQLAEWAAYMGNCIFTEYTSMAARGFCVLVALRHPDGRIAANVELQRSGDGWRIGEFEGRFSADVPPDLVVAVAAWVASVPPAKPESSQVLPRPRSRGAGPPARRRRPGADVLAARRALAGAAATALADEALEVATSTMAAVAIHLGWRAGEEVGSAAAAVQRASATRVAAAVGDALGEALGVRELWQSTSQRPLVEALARVGPEVRARLGEVERLGEGGPLVATLRPLVRLQPIGTARALDVAMRRLRRAFGQLIRIGDERADRGMATDPVVGALTAGVLAMTAWEEQGRPVESVPVDEHGRVGGVPGCELLDENGAWGRAWQDAAELGAPLDRLRQSADAGKLTSLAVPAAWLGRRGWPALWARARRHRAPAGTTKGSTS